MLTIIFLVVIIISIYIGFCVEAVDYTLTGKLKLLIINIINNLIECMF